MKIKNKYARLLILFGLCWAFLITILRALRWPNDWAEAHWLISYSFGFLKRALPGTLIAPLINSPNISGQAELVIKIISSAFFMIFCLGLLWICSRILKKLQFGVNSVFIVLVFLTSPYIVMSAHLNGYFDSIIIIISIMAILFVIKEKILIASIIISIGMLIHELILLVGYPSVIFIALIQHIKTLDNFTYKQLFISFISKYKLLFLIPLLTFSWVVISQAIFLDSGLIKSQLIAYISQFDFIQNKKNIIVPEAFTTSFFDYLLHQISMFYSRVIDPFYIIHIIIPLSVLLIFSWNILRAIPFNKFIFTILVAVTLLPLSLHIIAWDTSRIWTYPLIAAMLAIWGVCEYLPTVVDAEKKASLIFSMSALIIIVFQLFIHTSLMDGESERFSNELRILLYAPSLILIIMLVSKNYCLTSRSIGR